MFRRVWVRRGGEGEGATLDTLDEGLRVREEEISVKGRSYKQQGCGGTTDKREMNGGVGVVHVNGEPRT